ncbi:MAG: FAD-binding protein [Bacilli bacterium]|nr:MAG: FAD-binding protein [Bacilli bacterium]
MKLDRMNNIEIKDNIVVAGAGVSLIKLANLCMNNNLDGLSFAGGIPGLVGASTAMNAGAYNEDMSMIVKEAKVITPDMEIKNTYK